MENVFNIYIIFLIVCFFLGLIRVAIGPKSSDRMIASYLTGTIGAAIVLVLSHLEENTRLIDIALLFVLLGAMGLITFVNRIWKTTPQATEE